MIYEDSYYSKMLYDKIELSNIYYNDTNCKCYLIYYYL